MVLDRLHQMLVQADFTVMQSNIKQINLYYRAYGQSVYIFQVCNMMHGFRLTKMPYHSSLEQIRAKFYSQGYQKVELLSIIFSDDPLEIRGLGMEETGVWIVDALRNLLIIYENQPADYLGIRKPLEMILEEEPVEEKKKIRHLPLTFMNTCIILINVVVFIILEAIGDTQDGAFMVWHGAMYTPYIVNYGEFWRIFTSMFLHFGMDHLAGNMIMLLLMGDGLEQIYGKWRYLLIYLLSGLGAGMCSFLYNLVMGEAVVAAGASGAIFGVIGALIYVLWQTKGALQNLSALRLSILVLYILYNGIITPGIDNAAHISGLFFGFLLAIVLSPEGRIQKERKNRR